MVALSAGDKVSKYVIKQSLGSGYFGTCYQAFDRALARDVAIKIIPTQNGQPLKAIVEAQRQYLCTHNNCVQVSSADILQIQNQLCILIEMELMPGGSLQSRIRAEHISVHEAVEHMKQVLYGLEHAHSNGILHRDIKPANILLSAPYTKLSDFGIAVDTSQPITVPPLSYRSHTPPELLVAGAMPNVAADIYATGMTLFRLINNYSDWRWRISQVADSDQSIRGGTLVNDIGFQAHVPTRVARIVRKACHARAASRYQTCIEFRQALDRLVFSNDWKKVGAVWVSSLGGRAETLERNGVHIEHKINNRRRRENCNSFATDQEAESAMLKFIADHTLDE